MTKNAREGDVLNKYINAIEETRSSQSLWDESTIRKIEDLREQRDELVFLRHALTGQKVKTKRKSNDFKRGVNDGY